MSPWLCLVGFSVFAAISVWDGHRGGGRWTWGAFFVALGFFGYGVYQLVPAGR